MQRLKAALIVVLGLAYGCAPSLEGRYEDATGQTIYEFDGRDGVFVTALDVTVRGQYRIDGDRVLVTTPQGTVVLHRKAGRLVSRGRTLAPVDGSGDAH